MTVVGRTQSTRVRRKSFYTCTELAHSLLLLFELTIELDFGLAIELDFGLDFGLDFVHFACKAKRIDAVAEMLLERGNVDEHQSF